MSNTKTKSFSASMVTTLIASAIICVAMIIIAQPIQDLMVKIPNIWATYIAIITNIGILIWAWIRPKSFIFQDAPTQSKWRDLRIWITIFVAMQLIGYWALK